MTVATYRLRLRDTDHSLIDEVIRYRSLEYARLLNGVGVFTLTVGWQAPEVARLLDNRFLQITRDGRDEFYGLILGRRYRFGENAPSDEVLVVQGLHVNAYLAWREIVPPAGQSHDSRSGPADSLMKGYVDDHLGPAAAVARQYAYLSIAADVAAAPSRSYNGRYPLSLLSAVQDLGRSADVDFEMVHVAGGMEFRTYYPRRGLDRTRGNGVNPPVIFSQAQGNVRSGEYAASGANVVNYVYAMGQGEGALREVVEREDVASISAWGRRELAVDARHLEATAKLEQRGDEELARRTVDKVLTLEAMSVPGCRYGVDWDLGDLVTGEIAGQSLDAKIAAVTVKVESGGPEEIRAVIES